MSLFKPRTWGIVKAARDIQNYADWIKTIKREEHNAKSKYSQWDLNHNPFYTLWFIHNISEEENQLPEKVMRIRMMEMLNPLHKYLDEELGFAEYLVPEINRFYDDDGNPTLSFLIMYRFTFNFLSLKWIVKWLAFIVAGAFVYHKGWVQSLVEWVKNLI